ncbi:Protein mpe1 [Pseudogymnoascus australis]
MTSSVFFKFKSQREPSRVEFDGTGISVFELKRDIIIKSGLGDGTEFDLAIYNEDGNEEYTDDTTIIPRSTSIIARRLPPLKAGAGRAARYMSGKMPVNAKNSSRKEMPATKSTSKAAVSSNFAPKMNDSMTEEQRMAAMFQAQNEQWSAQQDEMANQTPVARSGGNKKGGPPPNVPDHEPPTGYVCYRCGEKGHWIQVCPTNDDPTFDNKPRVKRTTGIPRSFLKAVEKPVALTGDGMTDDVKAPSGVMVNAEGEFVVAEPDKASWEQFQAKTKSSAAAQQAAASGNKELQDRGLECPIDKRMFIDPMKTPCCEKTYCNDCITNALIESDFTCPGCQTDEVLIDNLKPDEEMSKLIKDYIEEKENIKEAPESPSKPESASEQDPLEPAANKAESASPRPGSPGVVSSPKPSGSEKPAEKPQVVNPTGSDTKKRPAEDLLENPKIPKGPKAMQQQEAQRQAGMQQQTMMNGMNPMQGFPNAPFDMSQQFGNGYGMGMGMGNMNMMNAYGMMNPMMNPMMAMNGFPMNGGFPGMNMPNMNGPYGGGYGGGMGNQGGGYNNGNASRPNMPVVQPGQFPNQQKTVFAGNLPNEEDNAYFRNPVNPHRHQGRQKRSRPSDFREL